MYTIATDNVLFTVKPQGAHHMRRKKRDTSYKFRGGDKNLGNLVSWLLG